MTSYITEYIPITFHVFHVTMIREIFCDIKGRVPSTPNTTLSMAEYDDINIAGFIAHVIFFNKL